MWQFYLRFLLHWLSLEEGQDLMEYGLIALLISVIAVAALSQVGVTLVDLYYSKIPGALGT